MARPRSRGNKDLPTELYRRRNGVFYARHPITRRQVSLDTRNGKRARKLFDMLRRQWSGDVDQAKAEVMARKVNGAGTTNSVTVAAYAADWRVRRLPKLLRKGGRPLAEGTKAGYDGLIRRDWSRGRIFSGRALPKPMRSSFGVF